MPDAKVRELTLGQAINEAIAEELAKGPGMLGWLRAGGPGPGRAREGYSAGSGARAPGAGAAGERELTAIPVARSSAKT